MRKAILCKGFPVLMRSLMTSVEHKYSEHPDFIIRHLEWYAFHHILYDGNWAKIGDAIPAYYQRAFYWQDHFNTKAKDKHHQIKRKVFKKEIITMEEFYRELDKILKPKPFGNALKDKKQRTAQSAYQKEEYRMGNFHV